MKEAPLPIARSPDEQGITSELLANGVRLVLPRRSGRQMRIAGGCLAGFSLFFVVFGIVWIVNSLGMGSRGSSNAPSGLVVFQYVFALFGLLPTLVGLGMLLVGLGAAAGVSRCEVEVTHDQLRVIERLGPLRKTFRRQAADIETLTMETAVSVQSGNTGNARDSKQPALVARGGSAKPLFIGVGYPRDVLCDLALRLQEQLDLRAESVAFGGRDAAELPTVSIIEQTDEEPGDADDPAPTVLPQPAASDITVELSNDELHIFVPASGMVRGSKGLFVFSLLWLGFITVFSIFWVPAWWSQGGWDRLVALFVVPFWAVGIGMFLAALNMGRRQAYIDIVADTMLISRKGVFGIKQREFAVDDITSVRAGNSGMEVNNVPILELQIHTTSSGKYGMLSQRENDELRWLASVLRHFISPGRNHSHMNRM